jgi:hypothetical protein
MLRFICDKTGSLVINYIGDAFYVLEFDLTNQPSGAYLINVEHSESNKKYTSRERIVKEKLKLY